MKEKDIGD